MLRLKRLWLALLLSLSIGTVGIVVIQSLAHNGYRLCANISESLPGYVYIAKHESNMTIHRGDLVMFRLPIDVPSSYYFRKGDLFLKVTSCVGGDILNFTEAHNGYEYFCNGQLIGRAIKRDKFKNVLPHPFFQGKIPEGYLFVSTKHPYSFDSRYFGILSEKDIIGKARYVF